MEFVRVPGATFTLGSPKEGSYEKGWGKEEVWYCDERPEHKVTVATFEIGKHAVTVAQFRAFLKDTARNPAPSRDASAQEVEENGRAFGVSWDDAQAFCNWAGYRLPTETEWDYAARSSPDSLLHASGPSWCGVMDVGGEMWEWCSSKYKPYPYVAGDGREDLSGSDSRVFRGCENHSTVYPHTTRRYTQSRLEEARFFVGFRCARTP